jgi:peptide chain release factor 2
MQTFHISLLKKASKTEILRNNRTLKKLLDIAEFIEMALLEDTKHELADIIKENEENTLSLLKECFLSPFEKKKEFLFQIQTGSGGDDAEELSLKLLKSYLQYLEKKNIKFYVSDITYSKDSKVGLKKCIVRVHAEVCYFLMEEGIHKFIRISPFNQKRHTSFVAFSLYPYISEQDKAISLEEKDLRIDVFRASGAGGQHVNTTESAVRITHLPTGLSVQCQDERSQHQNKAIAMNMIRSILLKRKADELESVYKKEKESISWSNHFRTYTFHPTKRIKDDRLDISVVSGGIFDDFFNGRIDLFIKEAIWKVLDIRIEENLPKDDL